MNKRIRKMLATVLTAACMMSFAACGNSDKATTAAGAETKTEVKTEAKTEAKSESKSEAGTEGSGTKKEIVVLAAASLTDVCGELEKMYEEQHQDIDLVFSFAGSGALQTQIEEGAPADIFISAAQKQMKALKEESLMKDDTICDLLENKVVLIVPADSTLGITSFEDVKKDEVKMVGLGELESVPAGQYAKAVFTSLGFWEDVEKKANFGTDVRTVLTWVEAGEVDCGVVYATDAYTTDKVKIVAEAPEGSCDKVVYPAGVVGASKNADDAAAFLDYLKTDEATKVFEKYGFVKAQ